MTLVNSDPGPGNHVGLRDGRQCVGQRAATPRAQTHAHDPVPAFTDFSFAQHATAIF